MNLNDMMEEMSDHGFTDLQATRLTGLINDAYYDVCSREPWPFLEAQVSNITTTAGSADITEPSDFGQVQSIVIDSQGIALVPKRWEWINQNYTGALTSTGVPLYYYFVGDQIKLYPVPDAAYTLTLQYLRYPTPLSAGLDTPILPTRHHRIILLGALVSAYNMEDSGDEADRFEKQFEKRIALMRNDLWMRQYDRPDFVQAVADSDAYDYYYEDY